MRHYLLLLLAALLTSCSDDVCCTISEEASIRLMACDGLYDGQTEICYSDPNASRLLNKDDWAMHMESLECKCVNN